MHQGQIEKRLLHGVDDPIEASSDGLRGYGDGFGVRGVGRGGGAVDVAGELVEEEEEGEGAGGGRGPGVEGGGVGAG